MNKAMVKRIVFGTAMTAAVLLVIWLEYAISQPCPSHSAANSDWSLRGLPAAVVILALLVVGFFELNTLAKSAGTQLLMPAGLIGTLLIAALPKLVPPPPCVTEVWDQPNVWYALGNVVEINPLLIVALVVAGVFFNQICTRRVEGALSRIAATLLAVTYLGVCGAMVLSLRTTYGLGVLLVFLSAVKLTDVGAYFVGSLIGRHKIIPWLSPGKSWEGLFGGLLLAGLTGWAAWWAAGTFRWMDFPLSLPASIAFCLILGVVGQFGDLCESLLKRSAGVKDAGRLVPQFGGVLDIIDSPLIAAPVAHVLLLFLYTR